MAIALADNGSLNAGQASCSPAFAATASAGDLLLLPCWSSSDDDVTPDTPAGWSLLGSTTGGTGSHGASTGPRTVTVFYREADGTEDLGETVTVTNSGAGGADRLTAGHIVRLTKTLAQWDLAVSVGHDNSAGTDFSVTGSSDPGGAVGDMLLVVAAYAQASTTLSSPTQIQSGLSWSGTTLGSGSQLRNSSTLQGDDARQLDGYQMVTAGTSAGSPNVAATTSGSIDGGPALFVRVREQISTDISATVEIAFESSPDALTPTWTDVTDYVEAESLAAITRGRTDELSDIQPSTLSLMLDNSDGRFTPGNSGSPYYPYVKLHRKIRVQVSYNGTTYDRFTGYVNEWPIEWPGGNDSYAATSITASSRQARMASGNELRSVIEEEALYDSPVAYYPMGEAYPGGGAGKAGDITGNQQPNLVATGSGTGITWQGATGPGTDGISAPLFNGGKYLEMTTDDTLIDNSQDCLVIGCFFNSTGGSGANRCLMSIWTGNHYVTLELEAGFLDGTKGTHLGSFVLGIEAPSAVNDGNTHHAALRLDKSSGDLVCDLFLDGVIEATHTITGGSFNTYNRLDVGAYVPATTSAGNEMTGTISHAFVYCGPVLSDARIAAQAQAGLDGFVGDSTDERILRIARYAEIDSSLISAEAGSTTSMTAQEITGSSPLDLMKEVARTENGLLVDKADGTLEFQARSHRFGAATLLTLDASLDEIEATLAPRMDNQLLVNDITASRPDAPDVRGIDQTSKDQYGIYRDQIDILTTDDDEITDAINWKLNRYAEPIVRIQEVSVDLLNSSTSQAALLLSADIGDRITLTNLPAQAPETTMSGFIEGIREEIGSKSHMLTFQLSPTSQSDVWSLDSSTFSVLDESTILGY